MAGGLPLNAGIVTSGTTPSVGTFAVQGTNLVPQPVCSNRKGTGTIRPILERKNYSIFSRNKKLVPVSDLEPVPVSIPVSKKSSSENVTNTTSDNVIEEFNLDPLSNPYFFPKSREEKSSK